MPCSTMPFCLQRLEELRKCAPDGLEFDIADVYEISQGMNMQSHLAKLLPGYNVTAVLASIAWWTEVATAIANGRQREWRHDLPDASPLARKFRTLIKAVLAAFPPALLDTPDFAGLAQDGDQTAAVELFRRYWRFTREIRSAASELWPDADLSWLWVQP